MTKTWQPWTDEQLDIIRREYPEKGGAGLALVLGRNANAIANKAFQMGVRHRPKGMAELPRSLRLVATESPSTVGEVIGHLRTAGRDVQDLGNGLFMLGKRKCTAQQLVKAARDYLVRTTTRPLPVLGEPDICGRSLTGCSAARAAEG